MMIAAEHYGRFLLAGSTGRRDLVISSINQEERKVILCEFTEAERVIMDQIMGDGGIFVTGKSDEQIAEEIDAREKHNASMDGEDIRPRRRRDNRTQYERDVDESYCRAVGNYLSVLTY